MLLLGHVYSIGMNQTNLQQKIQELKDLIDEARMEGLHNIANLWVDELVKVQAMIEFDRKVGARA